MLGKLIKNEFRHRYKFISLICAGMLAFSIFIRVLVFLENNVINNSYFTSFAMLTSGIFGACVFFSAVAVVFQNIADFNNRFFKSQGYLTHTLPVKTSNIIFSRMLVDIVVVVIMVILYPLCISIAAGSFEIYEEIADVIVEFVQWKGYAVKKATVLGIIFFTITAMFLSTLFSVWQFNTSLAIGHTFRRKKVASVVAYISIFLIEEMLMVFVIEFIQNWWEYGNLESIMDNISSEEGLILLLVILANIVILVGTAILGVITNHISKTKLIVE